MNRIYLVNECFASIQGEGHRAGTANVFLRFSKCNLTCRKDGEAGFDCDTEFESGRKMTLAEVLALCRETGGPQADWVILTGGEPALQTDKALLDTLHLSGFKVAIETNGTLALPDGLDWVSVSPKTAEHTMEVKQAHEVRYVRRVGQGIPKPSIDAVHDFLSPAFDAEGRLDMANLAWCMKLVLENPGWRISMQQHKIWRVR